MSEDNMVILRYGIFEEMTSLINYARDHFEVRQILDDSQVLYRYAVENGENGVSLRPSKDIFVVLPLDCDPDMLHFDHRIDLKIAAPVSIGQRLGTLTVYYGHLVMGNCDLVAMHAVAGQGTSIQDADRIEIVPWQEDGFWKTLLSYAAFILLGAVVLYLLIRGLINAVRNAKSRKAQRKKAKQRKRSRP
jgi:D-alanyl-D-alanine carboxypeptidase